VDLFASFQRAVVTALVERVEAVRREEGIRTLALSGGVASNTELRATFSSWGERHGVPVLLPAPSLTTDNAAMVAWAGALRYEREGAPSIAAATARSRWPLGS
jgi:tRNA N6-adenosine threonylcarbamoyltransferase